MSEYILKETYEHPDGAPHHKAVYSWTSNSPLEVIPRDAGQKFFIDLFKALAERINEITTRCECSRGEFEAGGYKAIVNFRQKDNQRPSYSFTATSDNGGGDNWADEKLAYLAALARNGRNYTAPMPVRDVFSVISDGPTMTGVARVLEASFFVGSSDQVPLSLECIKEKITASSFPIENTLFLSDSTAERLAKVYNLVPYYGALRFRVGIDLSFDGGLTRKPAFCGWVTVVFSGASQDIDLEIASRMIRHLLNWIQTSSSLVRGFGFDFEADGLFENPRIKRWLLRVLRDLGCSTSQYE